MTVKKNSGRFIDAALILMIVATLAGLIFSLTKLISLFSNSNLND